MITQRAFLVAVVGFCFYLIALVNSLPSFYYALTWLSFSVLMSCLGLALLSLVGLDCRWRISGMRGSEDLAAPDAEIAEILEENSAASSEVRSEVRSEARSEGPLLEIELSNAGTLSKTGLILEVQLLHRRRDEVVSRRFLIEALPSGAAIATTLTLRDLPRGRYALLNMRLIGSDVLGLFHVQRRVKAASQPTVPGAASATAEANTEAEEFIVGPATVPVADGAAHRRSEGAGSAGEAHLAARSLGQGSDIRGTRPYIAGDDLRRVHWKSTARRGQLVVKEFDQPTRKSFVVVWDGAAGTSWGEDGISSTEWGLRLSASLCRAIVEAGRPCALWRLDSQPLLLPSGRSTGRAGLISQAIEVLADADAARETLLSREIKNGLAGLAPGTTLFLVSASLDADLLTAALAGRAKGLETRVALLNGAAFLHATLHAASLKIGVSTLDGAAPEFPMLHERLARLRQSKRRAARQHWQTVGNGDLKQNSAPITEAAYQAQEQALRAAGVPTVMVSPGASPQHFVEPLQRVLHDLLATRSTNSAASTSPAATSRFGT